MNYVNLSNKQIRYPGVVDGLTVYKDRGVKPVNVEHLPIKAVAVLAVLVNVVGKGEPTRVIVDDDVFCHVNEVVGDWVSVIAVSHFTTYMQKKEFTPIQH